MTVHERIMTATRLTSVSKPRATQDVIRWWDLARLQSWASAAAAAGLAALVTYLLVAVPVLVAWFADTLSTVSVWQALGVASAGWALAHRGVVVAPEVSVQLTPLLLTALPVLVCRYAARHVLTDPDVGSRRSRKDTIKGFAAAWRGVHGAELVAFVVGYLATGVAICAVSRLGAAAASLWLAVPGLVLVPLSGIGLALLREHRRAENPTIDRALRWMALRVPVLARRALKPAGEALAALGVLALLIVVALLVTRGSRIVTLYGALDTGTVGVGVLTLGQLLLLPNLMLWALGWMAGPGMSIGTVHVSWQETTTGDLPLVPVLASLPEPGAHPMWVTVVAALPVLVGGWIGLRSARSAPRLASWWTKAQVALAACAWVAFTVLALSWLAAGSMTPGLMGTIGTQPWGTTAALGVELVAGSLLVLTTMHILRRRL
ncbi:MAG TPA: DUF6350 family protein [Ornithinimicrobium sp.]|uniref:cell division protein PerM n=1 Tax=Ornithinimicrobium sp. TaxID=1977084 RepID=UPI002B4874F1|nr:DUF6350 family protein [Ornithinimicrobium sp.]HKJ12669.1 DUF6350 family protein [Ornithinimicrobium sp.]